jgi:hypothetical protein
MFGFCAADVCKCFTQMNTKQKPKPRQQTRDKDAKDKDAKDKAKDAKDKVKDK